MEKTKFSRIAVMTVVATFALVAGIICMSQINPYLAGNPRLTRTQAKAIAEEYLLRQQFNLEGFFCDELFVYRGSSIEYLMSTFGVKPVIALGREDKLPLSYWQLNYYRNEPKDQQREAFTARVSSAGKLLGFHHTLADSTRGDSLSAEAALQIAQTAMRNWPELAPGEFKLEQSSSNKKLKRTDHKLIFTRTSAALGEAAEVFEVNVAGSQLASAMRSLRDPQDFVTASGVVSSANILINTASVAVYVVLLFVTLIAFLRKYHEGEIGVRMGLWLAGIIFFTLVLSTLNTWERMGVGVSFGAISHWYSKFLHFAFQAVFGYNFIALMILGSWTVGEQFLRIDKPRLLSGVDSLFNRQWFTKNLGREVPVGFGFGLIAFGVMQALVFIMIEFFGALPRLSGSPGGFIDNYVPFFSITAFMLLAAFFDELVFRLFLVTSLRRLLKSTAGAIALSAVLYGTFSIFFNDTYGFRQSYLTLIPFITLGLVQGYIFWRHGLLAAMTSISVVTGLNLSGHLLASSSPFFFGNGLALMLLLAGVLIVGLASAWRGKIFHFKPEDEPAHIRRIKERVRLQKELEIARRVQLGLLPKTQPVVAGFNIAGACLPALEVGGDYFDFVELRDGNLGIAVGDVSGKGVPAAIYMTLTKGILQSHAGEELSPKQVLSKVNRLMYRTIERNWYVSMFYAVLDARQRVLRFARAGHNPGIVFKQGENEAQYLQTAGIGLGLDAGAVFTNTLVEGELQISPGDALVLYTDGFTEAMNGKMQEFGEDRFLELLQRFKNHSAEELVQRIFAEVKKFAGDHPQHDDMTLVVLKAA